jgi:hypothetical protein
MSETETQIISAADVAKVDSVLGEAFAEGLKLYTALKAFTLAHCHAGEHEAFSDPAETGNPVESLGMVPCDHRPQHVVAGDTVGLTDAQADEHIAAGNVAPLGSTITSTLTHVVAPPSGGDDTAAVQSAIDAASAAVQSAIDAAS